MITVSLSSVREIGPRDINGASSFTIGERSREIYSGAALDPGRNFRARAPSWRVALVHEQAEPLG